MQHDHFLVGELAQGQTSPRRQIELNYGPQHENCGNGLQNANRVLEDQHGRQVFTLSRVNSELCINLHDIQLELTESVHYGNSHVQYDTQAKDGE